MCSGPPRAEHVHWKTSVTMTDAVTGEVVSAATSAPLVASRKASVFCLCTENGSASPSAAERPGPEHVWACVALRPIAG